MTCIFNICFECRFFTKSLYSCVAGIVPSIASPEQILSSRQIHGYARFHSFLHCPSLIIFQKHKKERKHSFLAPHHFLCFLVFILFPAFLLVYNQSKVVLVFPPSASLNIKKHQKTILCFLMSFLSFQANA